MRKTLNVKRLSSSKVSDLMNRWLFDPETITNGNTIEYPDDVDRPKTRGDCVGGLRPCPFVSCEFNLYLDVNPENGAIKINFPLLEVWELSETCALDVADAHPDGAPLPVVAASMGLSYDRTFQVVDEAKDHAKDVAIARGDDDGPWAREQRKAKREQREVEARMAKKKQRREP